MTTILISGSGTGVGKTRVTATLARLLSDCGCSVQIVKPVQTGVTRGQPSDADIAAKSAGAPRICAITLRRFSKPLAPISAARAERKTFEIKKIVREIKDLPACDYRLVEGAGGIAVPLKTKGYSWAEFANSIKADAVMLVVSDELGAINQARTAYEFARTRLRSRMPCAVVLNAMKMQSNQIYSSNRQSLKECGVPLLGELGVNAKRMQFFENRIFP